MVMKALGARGNLLVNNFRDSNVASDNIRLVRRFGVHKTPRAWDGALTAKLPSVPAGAGMEDSGSIGPSSVPSTIARNRGGRVDDWLSERVMMTKSKIPLRKQFGAVNWLLKLEYWA
jgi:hypothetical protein